MPSLSPTMETGVIKALNVKVGDKVKSGDLIGEVETDKSTIDWESTDNGFVAKILEDNSKDIKVGRPVLVLAKEAKEIENVEKFLSENLALQEKKDTEKPEAKSEIDDPEKSPKIQTDKVKDKLESISENIRLTPAARMMVKSKQLDISKVKGTGIYGSITGADLKNVDTQPICDMNSRIE